MSLSFDRYETEFLSLCSIIESSIPNLSRSNHDIESSKIDGFLNDNIKSNNNSNRIHLIANQLNKCNDLVTQMSIEARDTHDTKQKRDHLSQVRFCKTRYRSLKEDFNTLKSRISLLSSNGAMRKNKKFSKGFVTGPYNSKEHLLSINKTLRSQTASLDRAMEVMVETQVVASEISEELQRSNEVICRARDKIRSMKGMTDRAKIIVNRMKMQSIKQKVIGSGVIGTLFIFLILFFWWF